MGKTKTKPDQGVEKLSNLAALYKSTGGSVKVVNTENEISITFTPGPAQPKQP